MTIICDPNYCNYGPSSLGPSSGTSQRENHKEHSSKLNYFQINTLRTGDADLRFNTRLFSLHNTLNYAIHRACLRMVLLTDVYRNLTSL